MVVTRAYGSHDNCGGANPTVGADLYLAEFALVGPRNLSESITVVLPPATNVFEPARQSAMSGINPGNMDAIRLLVHNPAFCTGRQNAERLQKLDHRVLIVFAEILKSYLRR